MKYTINIDINKFDSLEDIELVIIDNGQAAAKIAVSIITEKEEYICSHCRKHIECDKCYTQARFNRVDALLLQYGIRRTK